MNRIAFLIVGLMMMSAAGASGASQFGVEIEKAVNGGYEIATPIMLDAKAQLPFLPKAYLKVSPIFTAPRGEFISSLKSANHSRLDTVIGSGIVILGGNLEFETGATYWWGGNSSGVPEGWEMNNAVRYYFEW